MNFKCKTFCHKKNKNKLRDSIAADTILPIETKVDKILILHLFKKQKGGDFMFTVNLEKFRAVTTRFKFLKTFSDGAQLDFFLIYTSSHAHDFTIAGIGFSFSMWHFRIFLPEMNTSAIFVV